MVERSDQMVPLVMVAGVEDVLQRQVEVLERLNGHLCDLTHEVASMRRAVEDTSAAVAAAYAGGWGGGRGS